MGENGARVELGAQPATVVDPASENPTTPR